MACEPTEAVQGNAAGQLYRGRLTMRVLCGQPVTHASTLLTTLATPEGHWPGMKVWAPVAATAAAGSSSTQQQQAISGACRKALWPDLARRQDMLRSEQSGVAN